jgi:hypothetical protein
MSREEHEKRWQALQVEPLDSQYHRCLPPASHHAVLRITGLKHHEEPPDNPLTVEVVSKTKTTAVLNSVCATSTASHLCSCEGHRGGVKDEGGRVRAPTCLPGTDKVNADGSRH